jgi:hypothetical protein
MPSISITINKKSSYSFRYQNKAVIPQVRTTHYGLESFNRVAGAKLWNELLNCFRKETSTHGMVVHSSALNAYQHSLSTSFIYC